MNYRDAAPRQRDVVVMRYRPMPIAGAIALTALLWLMSLLTLMQGVSFMSSARLRCEGRDCTVVRTYGFVDASERFARAEIRAVDVTSHSSKSGTNFGVAIYLSRPARVDLIRHGSIERANETKQRVMDVLEGRVGETQLQGWSLACLFYFLIGAGLFAAPLAFIVSARIEFDFDRGKVRHTLVRWPLRSKFHDWDGRLLGEAHVVSRPGSRGGTIYELMIDNVSVAGSGGSAARNEQAASQINAYLERMKSLDR